MVTWIVVYTCSNNTRLSWLKFNFEWFRMKRESRYRFKVQLVALCGDQLEVVHQRHQEVEDLSLAKSLTYHRYHNKDIIYLN